MNISDSPMLSSSLLSGPPGTNSAPLSLLSNVVQREKVRIEEKASPQNGAAGWSERPFSPVISHSNDIHAVNEAHSLSSLAMAMMGSSDPSSPSQPPCAASSSSAENNSTTKKSSSMAVDDTKVPPTKSRVLSKEETDKIREQFDSYLADPRRRSRQLDQAERGTQGQKSTSAGGGTASNRRARDLSAEARLNLSGSTDPDTEPDSDTSTDSDSGDDQGPFSNARAEENSLTRSKTIASTGVRSRRTYRHSTQFASTGSNGQYGTALQPAKEAVLRHHASSGSLRSVARYSDAKKPEAPSENEDESRTKVEVQETHSQGSRSGTGSSHRASSSATETSTTSTTAATGSSSLSLPQQPPQSLQQHSTGRKPLPIPPVSLSRPPAAYKVPVESPRLGPASEPLSMGLLSVKSAKTVVDEEGGDWELQVQPRRYNSVKLGMTGVTGVTRRAIGRPVERGHGIERGPEDCV
ncbi:MAG: hypothetical protein J3Q66DRAFT_356487 [Benniella sp.]|nr:MAG: hypothetical protein J3Q66DRAFT_356487 [Benniella sp.]